MKLNDLELSSFAESKNEVTFVFPSTVEHSQVLALDGQTLTIASNGSPYKTFEGYSCMSVGYTSQSMEHVRGRFFRKLSDQTQAAIDGVEENMSRVDNLCRGLQSQIDTLAGYSGQSV